MKKCKECGTDVSSSARVCPKCGKKLKHIALRVALGVTIAIIGICVLANEGSSVPTISSSSEKKGQESMNMEKFSKIETGMTYDEVVSIVGQEGSLSTESSYEDQNMKIYYWYAENGIANATVSFMNGKVTAKNQIGLQ